MVIQPHENICACGSGKRIQDCNCTFSGGQIIHFSLGKHNHFHTCMADMTADLIDYARRYYYLWESLARTRFTSYSQIHELNDTFLPIFWHWFVSNYRIHDDVSPIVDFYLAENEDHLSEREKGVLRALSESYLSIYQVIWVKNNTLAIRDIFNEETITLERDYDRSNTGIINGVLLLMRLARIESIVVPVNKPVIVQAENKKRIIQEMDALLGLERINDPHLILRNNCEKLCGLLIDLVYGQKNRVIAQNISLEGFDTKKLVKILLSGGDFIFLERNEKWLKYTRKNNVGVFSRIYLGRRFLVAVSEDRKELADMVEILNNILYNGKNGSFPIWQEGYYLDYPETVEIFHLEIMHDMYLEEWLDKPLMELDNLSPLQAVADAKGRVLLARMLENMETLELRAQSKGEYFLPVSVIRTKLDLDKDRISRELLHPRAIAIQVEHYRSRQALDSYVWKYQWAGNEYRQVASAAVERFNQKKLSVKQLAWILYMWNEFSSIYRPALSKPRGWLAAMEYAYYECCGSPCGCSAIAKKYSVPIWSLSLRAQLVVRHFKRYPLDLNQRIVEHPKWENLSSDYKIQIYDELRQHMRIYSYNYVQEDERDNFYENINQSGKYWCGKVAQLHEQFFKDYLLFDSIHTNGSTIANLFWEDHACLFPSYLKTAAWNLMISCVGAYRVIAMPNNRLLFEDYFTGKCSEAMGNFSHHLHDEITPGMIVLTRLLPVNGRQLIREPFYVIMPDLNELFEKNLAVLMERFSYIDEADFVYLKRRGEYLLKAYFMALEEMEQNTMEALKKPLQLRWMKAELGEYGDATMLLEGSRKFEVLYSDNKITTFLWKHYVSRSNNQWGYVILAGSSLVVFAPPGKDMNRMLKNLRQVLRNVDLMVSFRDHKANLLEMDELEYLLIRDLTHYLNCFPEQAMTLLRQDILGDEEKEYEQGLFLLKLGSRLMSHLAQLG